MDAHLFIQEGVESGALHELRSSITVVGRGDDCGVQLADAFVSRRHFKIERDDAGDYFLVDLGGRNAVILNGVPRRERTRLTHGDEIRVGGTCLRFTLGATPEQAAPSTSNAETRQSFAADQPATDSPIVGVSQPMREVLAFIERAAPLDVTVLVTGESGTGKELVARALHEKSPRHAGPLVTVNCAAFPRDLIESELFGHEKGAFTGAVAQRLGKFEQANGGTLFLDEIGELPPDGQAKLLRVLEERKITRVGGTRELPVDVRIVAATHRDLHAMQSEGRFRLDLIYRLEVAEVRLPPLRERGEDVVLIARAFLKKREAAGHPALKLSDAAAIRLLRHDWPGNVRELRNVIERAALFAKSGVILPADIVIRSAGDQAEGGRASEPPKAPEASAAEGAASAAAGPGSPAAMDDVIKEQVERALAATGGNKKRAAELLKISRSSLYIYLDRFKLR